MPRIARKFGWAGREPFDARDRHYVVSEPVLSALPPAVSLRPDIKTPALQQGNIGSCGPHSAARELMYDQEQNVAQNIMPSRLQIYYHTRLLMGTVNQDSGVYNRDLCKALNQFGWADEKLWPYDTNKFRVPPPANVVADAATRKVMLYERVAQQLPIMKGCLAQGDPCIIGFTWYQAWESAAISNSGHLTLTSPNDRAVGGHDVTMIGYDDATQRFEFINSWGPGWGNQGYGTVPYAQWTDQSKASDFWTVRWEDAIAPIPPEPEPPNPEPPIPTPGAEMLVSIGQNIYSTKDTVTVRLR